MNVDKSFERLRASRWNWLMPSALICALIISAACMVFACTLPPKVPAAAVAKVQASPRLRVDEYGYGRFLIQDPQTGCIWMVNNNQIARLRGGDNCAVKGL